MLKKYLLYFLWITLRLPGMSLRTPLPFFNAWLTTLELGTATQRDTYLVVEQWSFTTLVVIPYSFHSLLLPTRQKVHAWLHRTY